MSGRFRISDLVMVGVLAVLLAGAGGAMLAGVGAGNEQARCAANMRLFGEALAGYEATWGVFPPCDPWPLMPQCVAGSCRSSTGGEQIWDPPHGRLLYHMGYVPNLPADAPASLAEWYTQPWGFYYASTLLGEDGVPAPAICPSAILENVMSYDSPEIRFGTVNAMSWAQVQYKYAACYTPNRMLRSPVRDRRLPSLPQGNLDLVDYDNQYSTAFVYLDLPASGADLYFIQGINGDEVLNPSGTAYMSDSLDYMIGDPNRGDELVDPAFGDVEISAGSWFALNRSHPATALGSRHGERANVLYVDGHVSDDNQTPRNRRAELITASTFADFIEDYGIGTQHHVMPGWRWVDTDTYDGYAPGDDEPPTVASTWPADGATISAGKATEIKISFSEQVWINQTNVSVNGGAVAADATSYSSAEASFTLVFDSPLAVGSYQVTVNAAVTDVMGNQLDGDGNGTGGDPYSFSFDVADAIYPGTGAAELQAAIDAAIDGDVIVLNPGTYPGRINFGGKAITVRSTDPTDPAVVAATIIDASGTFGCAVWFDSGETRDAVLDGVTLTGATGSGVCVYQTGPTIRRCRIEGNDSNSNGGGVYIESGDPIIENCIIGSNEAGNGAGIYSIDSLAVIRNNAIVANHALEEGAAIYTGFSRDLILNNTIVGNQADGVQLGGAAVFCVLWGDAEMSNNIFWQNTAEDLAIFDSEPAVACNLFAVVPTDYEYYGNIAGDPLLGDWQNEDFHIPYDSPCVNAGSRWYGPMDGVTDLDGQPRIGLRRVDIGADEVVEQRIIYVATCGDDGWSGADPNCVGPDGAKRTIQAAIDAAAADRFEIVMVLPGTYQENIDFLGKVITVTDTDPDDPNVVATTAIEGGSGPVVRFVSDEPRESIITGFTIRHAGGASGVGVECSARATILKNVVTGNDEGGIRGGAPLIAENVIANNGGDVNQGGGVFVGWYGAQIIGNHITQNQAFDEGGGIYGNNAEALEIVGNVIEDNTAGENGGGVYLYHHLPNVLPTITNNLLVGNASPGYGAMYCRYTPEVLRNNTIAFNIGQYAVATVPIGYARSFENCILFNPDTDAEAAGFDTVRYPNRYCLIRGWAGGTEDGNFDADPQFVDPNNGDYRLLASSPCVDAGDPNYLPAFGQADTDLAGSPRAQNGRLDIGAYELGGLVASEPSADGTLPKTQNNLIELVFSSGVALPMGAALSAVPLAGGDDLGATHFTYELGSTEQAGDTLRAIEIGAAVSNLTWYRVTPRPELGVRDFTLDMCTLIGDADGSGRVTTADYGEVKAHFGERTDARYDLNGTGRVTTADYTVVKQHLGVRVPSKPGP